MAEPMFGPQYKADQQGIDRRRKIAEMLMKQALQPQQGQMAGRIYVPPSPLSAVARVAQGYFGGKGMSKADEDEKALGERHQGALAKEVERIAAMRQGQPPTMDAADNVEQPAVEADPRAAITAALTSQYPTVQKMGALEFQDKAARERAGEARTENIAARRDDRESRVEQRRWDVLTQGRQRMDQTEVQAREGRITREEADKRNADVRRELDAAQRATQLQIAQMRMEAARNKAGEKVASKEGAQRRVSGNLELLSTLYDELDKLGGVVNAEKSSMSNVWSRLKASGIGQTIGGAFGTSEQSSRDSIEMMRPLLLQDIRKAQEMGVRGLDSNKELEFYMKAATDPTREIGANRAALSVLDQAFGLGMGVQGVSPEHLAAMRAEGSKAAGAPSGGPKRISSDAEYEALPSGTEFIAPDGSTRRKP